MNVWSFKSDKNISFANQSGGNGIRKILELPYTSIYKTNAFSFIVEGLKAVEIEKCKRDISDIKDQIWNAQKKFVDFNRMR